MKAIGLDSKPLQAFDYSTARVVLLTSVPGYHKGNSMKKYGHLQLREALKRENFVDNFQQSRLLCQVNI